jgi:YcaO-like protein with predicted kinase domain
MAAVAAERLLEKLAAPAPKSFRRGTHRVVSPSETLQLAGGHAGKMGVTRIANVTGLDHIGIPVAMAIRPNSRSLSVSQGKGLTLPQAMASALMETIELFHAEDILARCRVDTYSNIASGSVVAEPKLLARTSRRFRPDLEMPWIEGCDILRCEPCWVPYELVHTDNTLPRPSHAGYFLGSSNGLASGNHMAEAVSAAICELVERDAAAIWQASNSNLRAERCLDLTTIDDTDSLTLLEKLKQAGIGVRIWNITSDTGIAAFRCQIRELPGARYGQSSTFRGSGCHPARGVALVRALTEAVQSRLTRIAGTRDDLSPEDYSEADTDEIWEALLDVQNSLVAPQDFRDVPDFASDDVSDDVAWELDRLRTMGMERLVVVDLTRPEFGIPVVRVVAPGIEGIYDHPDYTPGKRALLAQSSVS